MQNLAYILQLYFVFNYFKYSGVILNEDNNQTDLQKELKMLTKHILWYKNFLKIKTYQRN
jgi:hypothetical protein